MLGVGPVAGSRGGAGHCLRLQRAGHRRSEDPQPPEFERKLWYQYYLHGERGRAGLSTRRGDYAKLLWREWSPNWSFTEEDFAATRPSFDNPDFVDVVVHSYRHRYGLVAGDPAYEPTEQQIATQPPITVPAIVLDGEHGLVQPRLREQHAIHFPALLDYRCLDAGHNIPQESPQEFASAVIDMHSTL